MTSTDQLRARVVAMIEALDASRDELTAFELVTYLIQTLSLVARLCDVIDALERAS